MQGGGLLKQLLFLVFISQCAVLKLRIGLNYDLIFILFIFIKCLEFRIWVTVESVLSILHSGTSFFFQRYLCLASLSSELSIYCARRGDEGGITGMID